MSLFHVLLGKSTRLKDDDGREDRKNEPRAPQSKRSFASVELLGAVAGVAGYAGVLAIAIIEHHWLLLAFDGMLLVAALLELCIVVFAAWTAAKKG